MLKACCLGFSWLLLSCLAWGSSPGLSGSTVSVPGSEWERLGQILRTLDEESEKLISDIRKLERELTARHLQSLRLSQSSRTLSESLEQAERELTLLRASLALARSELGETRRSQEASQTALRGVRDSLERASRSMKEYQASRSREVFTSGVVGAGLGAAATAIVFLLLQ